MIEIPAGVATLGLSRGGESFGWDNEYEAHLIVNSCQVRKFAQTKISPEFTTDPAQQGRSS
jgi:hypothetical protein